MSGTTGPVVVVAAVLEREGLYCVTRRPPGTHLAGYWEFPGGKLESGEDHRGGLERELMEELGVRVAMGRRIHHGRFDYADRAVELHFYACHALSEPRPRQGQQMRWVSAAELATLTFPPADRELIETLAGGRRA